MFSEKERQIYRCPKTGAFHDPLMVKRRLLIYSKGGLNAAIATWNDEKADPVEKGKAEEVLVRAGRDAFGYPAIDAPTGKGIVDATVLEAVTDFTIWLRGKGETVQNTPTSAPCTDCPGN